MKNLFSRLALALLSLCTLHFALSTAEAQGTAFTYEGQLSSGGGPANGNYDFTFALFNNNSTNTGQIGNTLTNLDVGVTNGLFTVLLDFGSNYNALRWLAISVRTNGGASFTALNPLQELTPTPIAIYSSSSGSVAASNITGTIPVGELSGEVVTNTGTQVTLSGTFSGNGGGLTNLNPANIGAGTAGINISGNAVTATSATSATTSATAGSATTAVSFTGNLAGEVTGPQGATVVSSVPLAALPPAVVTNTGTGVTLSGTFSGDGAGLTNLNVALPGTVLTNNQSGVTLSGTFSGNGAALTNLNFIPPSTINESNITVGATNVIAPLTVPPTAPASTIGSVGAISSPQSVAVAGRYAYVVGTGGLQVFDVSTSSNPVSVGSAMGFGLSVAVAGRNAYVVGACCLQIFDVSTPSAPVNVGSATGYGVSVAVAGRYAYMVSTSGGLQIFDVSVPSAPVSVGSLAIGNGVSIAVAGRYAYVVGGGGSGLEVFDVSAPSTPAFVGSAPGNNGVSVAVAGRYAYVVGAGALQIFDVSAPSAPIGVGSVSTGAGSQSVVVAGRYAYVADNGLQIVDVSTPTAPAIVGSVLALSGSQSIAVAGRCAYVVNEQANKLQVFDLGGAYIQHLEAGAMETGTLQTRDTVTVGNNLDVRGGLTVSASARISGGLGVSGSVGIGISAPAYTLQVNGSVAGVGAYNNVSDARYKTNIIRLTHALDKIMALQGVEYDWRSNAYPQMKFDQGRQLGFVAQEIKEVLPEVVSQDAQGYYSIAYSKVIPVLVEAIKDQQKGMENQQSAQEREMKAKDAEIQALKQRLDKLESALSARSANLP